MDNEEFNFHLKLVEAGDDDERDSFEKVDENT
jgi:hypothetical protein